MKWDQVRPESLFYAPKGDDEYPRPFHMGVPPGEFTKWTFWVLALRGGHMVSALVSGSSGPGSSPGKTLCSHSTSLHPGVLNN